MQALDHPADLMDEKAAVLALGALAQSMRLRIFRALVGAGPEGMTPGALTALLQVSGSTVSFHLKELSHAGLVNQEREGRHLNYRPALSTMHALMSYLTAHCCEGSAVGGCELSAASCRSAG